MQHFINRAIAERAVAKALTGASARLCLFGLMASGVAATAGAAAACIWLGAALLVHEMYKTLTTRLAMLPARHAGAARTALDIAASGSLAAAPAMVWLSNVDTSTPLAALLLAVLTAHAAFAGHGRRRTLTACVPYALVAIAFMADCAAAGAFLPACTATFAGAYLFLAALHHTHSALHARDQDGQWLHQLNAGFADPGACAWEIDFARKRLVGGDRLSDLIDAAVTYEQVVGGVFAAPVDCALVQSAFAPARGGARRLAIEHELRTGERIRHIGFVRTAPDGAPLSLTCISQLRSAAADRPTIDDEQLGETLAAQARALKTLSNELSTNLAAAPQADAAAMLIAQQAMIEGGLDALAHARHAAESANLAKSQFLAGMSHELRTPLNAIIGYAEMLQEDAEDSGDDDTVQDLRRILAAAKHLLSLLNEILDLSKIEAGRMDVAAAPFEPLEMLDDLIETMRPLAEQNGNNLAIVGPRPQLAANTDAMKLRQCVLNLLSNACKFTKSGRIELGYERRAMDGLDQLVITVSDTGIGMSKEQLGRLFQPFVQAAPTITQQYGGTGLGLTITRRLCQLMGGDVSVECEVGAGATFTLTIPANHAEAIAAQGAAAAVDAVQGAENAPLVLVIEDEPDARELAARALTRVGFSVLGVGGGEAGMSLARRNAPALILLDIFLPDRSGWRVLQSLKHDPATRDIPVIVLSISEDRGQALALGAAEHIVKPADRDRLAATVLRYARKRDHSEAEQSASPIARSLAG